MRRHLSVDVSLLTENYSAYYKHAEVQDTSNGSNHRNSWPASLSNLIYCSETFISCCITKEESKPMPDLIECLDVERLEITADSCSHVCNMSITMDSFLHSKSFSLV